MSITKYTEAMVAKIVSQEPLNLDKAKILAVEFGMPDKYRSVCLLYTSDAADEP